MSAPLRARAAPSSMSANPVLGVAAATLTSPSRDIATSSRSTSPASPPSSAACREQIGGEVEVGLAVAPGDPEPAVERAGRAGPEQPVGAAEPLGRDHRTGEVGLVRRWRATQRNAPRPVLSPSLRYRAYARAAQSTHATLSPSHHSAAASPRLASPSGRRRAPPLTPPLPAPSDLLRAWHRPRPAARRSPRHHRRRRDPGRREVADRRPLRCGA